MGGADVYSASKAACENVTASWWKSFFLHEDRLGPIATARAGNVIGGGDYAADRILPDLVRAQLSNQSLEIRNPKATRPWQHVLDCLSGYLALGVYLTQQPKQPELMSFNFGPGPGGNLPVSQLVNLFCKHWSCPVHFGSVPTKEKEAERLNLSIEKAFELLRWKPVLSLDESVEKTAFWYRARHCMNTTNMIDISIQQIEEFENAAHKSQASWL
jgi:CDP-glucose 4,6-dehydratase